MESIVLITAVVVILFLSLMLFLALFEPGLPYTVTDTPCEALDSDVFMRVLGG